MSGCHIPECLCVCCNKIKERLTKLEKENEIRQNTIVGIDRYYGWECRQLSERMDSLEKSFDMELAKKLIYEGAQTHATILQLKASVAKIETNLQVCIHSQKDVNKKPHKCPVCDGCGNDKGTTESNPNFQFCMQYASCHACEGKGIVWG